MTNMTPTPGERRFLRGIAAVNPAAPIKPGRETGNWWSADDLIHTILFPDFRQKTALSLAASGRSAVRKGMAASRHIGTRGHGWEEYRITAFGRGLVSDSCIGGGLPWAISPRLVMTCPACRTASGELGITKPDATTPAHPLPGYAPVPAAGEIS